MVDSCPRSESAKSGTKDLKTNGMVTEIGRCPIVFIIIYARPLLDLRRDKRGGFLHDEKNYLL